MYVTSFTWILPRFFNFLQGTVIEKPSTQLKSKVAKFESDLLKTNEDGALQSRRILQTFVTWGARTCSPPYKRLDFLDQYLRSLWTITFKLRKLLIDICLLLFIKI